MFEKEFERRKQLVNEAREKRFKTNEQLIEHLEGLIDYITESYDLDNPCDDCITGNVWLDDVACYSQCIEMLKGE